MATLTITTTPAQDARIVAAFGKHLNTQDLTDPDNPVPRDATGAEVKQAVIEYIKKIVREMERSEAMRAARDGVTDIEPS